MSEIRTPVDVQSAVAVKELVIERTFAASPESVFDAFTDPLQLTHWWWPKGFACPSAEVDLRVGGTYRIAIKWPDDSSDARFMRSLNGEYYEVDRPHRLVMSSRAVNDERGELFATVASE
ncbi:MAG: hypothetical protein HKL81_06550 [Acidimicrobiaceae bacterium]|nr:hypothetical protein [Acidimicrobiaceae bacterium]